MEKELSPHDSWDHLTLFQDPHFQE